MNNYKSIASISSVVILSLAAVYAYLFFNFELGLNVIVFDAVLLLTTLKVRPDLSAHRGFVWSVAGLLFAAGSVVIVHGQASILAHHVSFLLIIGYAQARELRFIWFGMLVGLTALFAMPIQWVNRLKASGDGYSSRRWVMRSGPILAALTIALPFALFYCAGSEALEATFSSLFANFRAEKLVQNLLTFLLLMVVGVAVSAGLVLRTSTVPRSVAYQQNFNDRLQRGKTDFELSAKPKRTFSRLKGEARTAVTTLVVLNLLILLLNLADLRYVWLSQADVSAATLSHYVHVGTWNLIASICLAIGVILYFFRGSLNFMPSPLLRPLAIAWVAQNALLLLSVGVRNYYYVNAYGLAIGRVYVVFVLILLAFGLLSLFRKITHRLSLTYLLQSNGMALWLGLLVFGAVNWAGVITRYNLASQPSEEVDWEYLVNGFDGRNDFLLYTHPKATEQNIMENRARYPYIYDYTDWRGWNYAQYRMNRLNVEPTTWK